MATRRMERATKARGRGGTGEETQKERAAVFWVAVSSTLTPFRDVVVILVFRTALTLYVALVLISCKKHFENYGENSGSLGITLGNLRC